MQMGTTRKTEAKAKIASIVTAFGKSPTNTGSTESQIALITDRINTLHPHFEKHKKDNHSRRGLLKQVAKRRRLLNFLLVKSEDRYRKLIDRLNLTK